MHGADVVVAEMERSRDGERARLLYWRISRAGSIVSVIAYRDIATDEMSRVGTARPQSQGGVIVIHKSRCFARAHAVIGEPCSAARPSRLSLSIEAGEPWPSASYDASPEPDADAGGTALWA